MRTMHSFLRTRFLFKQVRKGRIAALAAGTAAAVALAFPSMGFGVNVREAAAVRTVQKEPEKPVKTASSRAAGTAFLMAGEEIRFVTEAKVQIELLNQNSTAKIFSGQLLAQRIRQQQEEERLKQERAEAARQERLRRQQEEEKRRQEEQARKEAEEAAQKAEEERRAARRIPCSEEDYQVLLRIVQAEAGICDEKGKILVANVIINRVLSDEFPDSVRDVVYEPSQFQPVSTGSINSVQVTDETIRCVDRALAGEDYSQGALYFMNRRASGSSASWFDRHLNYLFAHDGHEFFR